ncbi:RNA-directed DNA polymerase (Reverse transcriptase), partial [Trifolium medium]|nr:RNA-directed DNA polymerase (Reverse transcriptase) [Trifolium medium]
MSKSEVFFSRNISYTAQQDLAGILQVRHVLGTGTYLGLPSMIGRSKKATFSFIKDRIWRRINSWRGRSLSKAGKEVMIKSVLQAIPSYIMSIYTIPSTTICEIERMINGFWWGGGGGHHNKGIRWMAWDRLTPPKSQGGLGFRDFQAFNQAMIAKQCWNILQNPDSLVSQVFKARWIIGDGSKINVMKDPWIRKGASKWVCAPQAS